MTTTQIQVAAPAATKQAAQKTASKGKSVRVATPAPKVLSFRIQQGFRPMAGNALYAHTEAFMSLAGMYEGMTVPRATLAEIIGARAVQYHSEQGNFLATSMGVQLTEQGAALFQGRNIDPEMLKGFTDILTTGQTNDYVKNAVGIKSV